MVTFEVPWTTVVDGAVPEAVAARLMPPASTSACVTVYDAVQVSAAPMASVLCGHEMADSPGRVSVTPTEVSATLPVFVTR